MIITETILRIRAECPMFERRVGGTAKFSLTADMDSEAISAPCAFVMPMGDSADPRTNEDSDMTWMTERIGVIVCVSNRVDRSRGAGVSASDALKTAKQELYDALVNWCPTLVGKPEITLNVETDDSQFAQFDDLIPNSAMNTFSYMESNHLSMSTAKLWHQYEFEIRYMMNKAKKPTIEPEKLLQIYGGWSPEIGIPHIDDYDLIVDTAEEAIT